MLLLFADYISLIPIVIYFGLLYSFLINPIKNHLDLVFLIVILLSDRSVKYFKSLKYPEFMYDITRRPKGAKNCDFFSRKGPLKYGTPGFPSGHMTTVTFFSVFVILLSYHNYLKNDLQKSKNIINFIKDKNMLIIINLLLIIFTGWARWYKGCHNLFQVLGGFLLGCIYAVIFYFILLKLKKGNINFGLSHI